MSEVLVEQLRSESLHARYGAVKALRKIGPNIIGSVSPLITSPQENDLTRLSALEAIRPFYFCISEDDLLAFSSILSEPHTAALKIEVIKLLKLSRYVRALPAIRTCLDDDTVDERIQSWGFDDEAHQVGAYAAAAISAIESARDKAIAIFRELVGERADQLSVAVPDAQRLARAALVNDFDDTTARDIAFHMTDWNSDAAFVAAFLLFPERFTAQEIRQGIEGFLVHAPNHIAAAAKQHDYPIQDIFEVGALDGWPEDNEPEGA